MRLILLVILIFFACHDKKSEQTNEKLLYAALDQVHSDCIYCSNTQAMGGSCSCLEQVSIGSCAGKASGTGKSSSYHVSCSDLTQEGIWARIADNASFCESRSCPLEAYRAAFTENGL